MPRIRPLTDTEKRRQEKERFMKGVNASLTYYAKLKDVNVDDLARMTGEDRRTLYRKKRSPEKFTLSELYDIAGGLKVSIEEILEMANAKSA